MKGKLEEAQVFTTGEVAAILHCAPRTVNRLFDEGKLKGYTIPGGGHRRGNARRPKQCHRLLAKQRNFGLESSR